MKHAYAHEPKYCAAVAPALMPMSFRSATLPVSCPKLTLTYGPVYVPDLESMVTGTGSFDMLTDFNAWFVCNCASCK
jgi:hypothetical protein